MIPLFSIVLPTYSRAYVVWKAILSILAQSEPRWELIVVDDSSTDCTQRLLEEFQDQRITTITTANRGPSAARNHAVAHTQAPYVAYLDSDNTWHSNFLESMLEAIQQHPDAVLWHCGANGTWWERSKSGEWYYIRQQGPLPMPSPPTLNTYKPTAL
jgi:glycosyltransferase involved in cell wall biosynthesis